MSLLLLYSLVSLLLLPEGLQVRDVAFQYSPSYGSPAIEIRYPAHLDTALSYVGVTDSGGKNTGKEIDRFLASVGLGGGYAWCSAFVSYCLEVAQPSPATPTVRSALARHFKVPGHAIDIRSAVASNMQYQQGWIVGWKRGHTMFGHVGFIIEGQGASMITVEGNTSPGNRGSQSDGGGVHIRNRQYVASNYLKMDWITPVTYHAD